MFRYFPGVILGMIMFAPAFTAFSLPVGLTFNATSGAIFGTTAAVGTYEIPLGAMNASGSYASVLSLTVTQPLPPGIAPMPWIG